MADKTIIALREAAEAYAEAVRTTQRYFDRLEGDYLRIPVEQQARLDAIEAAGIEAPSIDESDPDN